MNEIVNTDWVGNMSFDSVVDGFELHFDSEQQFGGTDYGPRPKPIILSALAACTGMDIVSIMKKKQVNFTAFRIVSSGEMDTEFPKKYLKIHLVYFVTGPGFKGNEDVFAKVDRSVRLSRDKYCAVSAMLKTSCEITDEIILLDS
jgi:putative redox protein